MTSLILIVGTLTLSIPHQEAFAAPTEFMVCTSSSADNERMILTANILNFAGGGCIVITNNNVTLDCKGFTIDGTGVADSDGIQVSGDNVTIKNCVITDFINGIHFTGADNGTITKNTLESNTTGIQMGAGSDNNKVTSNTSSGNHVRGLFLFNSVDNKILRNNFDSNGSRGIDLRNGGNNEFSANTANGPAQLRGIDVRNDSDFNTFKRNTANSNTVNGIEVCDGCDSNTFTGNTTNDNTVDGINDDSSDTGTAGTANTYKRNSCSGNGVNQSEPAGLCS